LHRPESAHEHGDPGILFDAGIAVLSKPCICAIWGGIRQERVQQLYAEASQPKHRATSPPPQRNMKSLLEIAPRLAPA